MSHSKSTRVCSRCLKQKQAEKHAVWLQHTKTEKGKDRWVMTVFDPEVRTILDTGSSVLVLKQIRRMGLSPCNGGAFVLGFGIRNQMGMTD